MIFEYLRYGVCADARRQKAGSKSMVDAEQTTSQSAESRSLIYDDCFDWKKSGKSSWEV